MAVRGTSEIVFGTPYGTFWDHSGRFVGGGGGEGVHGGSSGLPHYSLSAVSACVFMTLLSWCETVTWQYHCVIAEKKSDPLLSQVHKIMFQS